MTGGMKDMSKTANVNVAIFRFLPRKINTSFRFVFIKTKIVSFVSFDQDLTVLNVFVSFRSLIILN